jgi:hypothetical protein
MLSRPERKASRIYHSPRKAKKHRLYGRADVEKLYNVCPNTVRNWMRQGLRPVPGDKLIFRGDILNAFHQRRNDDARKACLPGELYCVRCKARHSLIGRSASFLFRSPLAGTLSWHCPGCSRLNATYFGRSGYDRLVSAGVNLSSDNDD